MTSPTLYVRLCSDQPSVLADSSFFGLTPRCALKCLILALYTINAYEPATKTNAKKLKIVIAIENCQPESALVTKIRGMQTLLTL